MKKVHKDGTPVKIQRTSNGIRYMKGQERAKVITFLKDRMRAYAGKPQGFEAHRDKTIFELGFYTGFRVEEIYHIDIEDVCHPESLPHEIVLKTEIIVVGKGDVLREVPVTKPLRDALESFLKAKRKAGEALKEGAPLFCSFNGSRLAYRSLQSVVERRCSQAGLVDVVQGKVRSRFSIHALRHTFAVLWLAEHDYMAPAEAYKRLSIYMGHTDIQTTQKYTRYDVRVAA